MITLIGLSNFKCFDNLKLITTPLSVLCGLNGMGKSSVIQALLILRQSFLSGELSQGRLVLSGDLADIGTGADILFEDATTDSLGFELEWTHENSPRPWALTFEYKREADRLQARAPSSRRPPSFVPILHRKVPPFGGEFDYIGAERLGPRKTHLLSDTRERAGDLGPRGEYVLNYINSRPKMPISEGDLRAKKAVPLLLAAQLDAWLQEITPGVHLEIEPIRAADVVIGGFTFDKEGDVGSRRFRATNVGFGLSYVLPVIVALLANDPGALVLLENPEAHMHPRGQTMLGQLTARAAAVGVQVIVETHSDHFIDGIRIAVRDGIVRPDQVSFHYFERLGSSCSVVTPKIDADGRLSSWPKGFFDQQDENLVQLLAPKR